MKTKAGSSVTAPIQIKRGSVTVKIYTEVNRVNGVPYNQFTVVRLQEVATRHGVGRSTVQGWRYQLTELVRTFMGADVLHLIQRTPQWRENLTAMREQMACRMGRRMA